MTKQELLIKFNEKITNVDDAEDFFSFLALTNTKSYNITKLLEELSELSEKLLKSINKHSDHKPSQNQIVDEIGDVMIRSVMYCICNNISEDDLKERLIHKANKFREYIEEGIYSNL